ncbi:hypothetical protein THAOC_21955, partial [Thalassiosira oceanica]
PWGPLPAGGLGLSKTLQFFAANHGQTYRGRALLVEYFQRAETAKPRGERKIFNGPGARPGQTGAPTLKDTHHWRPGQTGSGRGVELATWEASVEISISSSVSANKIVEESVTSAVEEEGLRTPGRGEAGPWPLRNNLSFGFGNVIRSSTHSDPAQTCRLHNTSSSRRERKVFALQHFFPRPPTLRRQQQQQQQQQQQERINVGPEVSTFPDGTYFPPGSSCLGGVYAQLQHPVGSAGSTATQQRW